MAQFRKIVQRIQSSPIPTSIQNRLVTVVFNSAVKFAGLAGVRIQQLQLSNESSCTVVIKKRLRVTNHIGETATGVLLSLIVPETSIPLCKSLNVNFKKTVQGDVTAVATLSPEQALKIRNMPKGDIIVPVRLSDSRGNEPAVAEMCWAWHKADPTDYYIHLDNIREGRPATMASYFFVIQKMSSMES